MRIVSLLLVSFMVSVAPLPAQQKLHFERSCGYIGEISDEGVYGFTSDQEARMAIDRIMRYTGLPSNFTIQAANVPNAAAIIQSDKRYILYNQYFMERVKDITRTDWAALSIMAHEIGHHLSGHTLDNAGSRPDKELQADRFSGFVLYKMGASLQESRVAMQTIASDRGSATHPGKSARLAAITNGWMSARDLDENINPIGVPSRSTAANKPLLKPDTESTPTITDTYSVHSMLQSEEAFPSLKDEWAKGRHFLDGFKLLNRWNVITGPKPHGYRSQAYRTRKAFPEDEIKKLWDEDYRITRLRYVEDVWLLVMTKFNSNPAQRWRKRPDFPKEEIKTGWDEGYFVSDVAYGEGEYVVVMNKKPEDYVSQRYSIRQDFPSERIQELWDDRFNITSLRYLNDQWVLVMTKYDTFRHQLWRTRKQFPKAEIIENEKRGYQVTELSYGNGIWALVMTKE